MFAAAIPCDVWADTLLEMLDARDLISVLAAYPAATTQQLPTGTTFVAKRVLSQEELDWFAAQKTIIRLELMTERRVCTSPKDVTEIWQDVDERDVLEGIFPFTVWLQNGQLHRDNDLPAVEMPDGSRSWWFEGKRHREGGLPAVEHANGVRTWYYHGNKHRDGDLPAVETTYGTREWWVNGKQHRDGDLPAAEYSYGEREWWVNGERHRENDLPAFEGMHGDRFWYLHGKQHRGGDLPAVMRPNGQHEWWVEGERTLYRGHGVFE